MKQKPRNMWAFGMKQEKDNEEKKDNEEESTHPEDQVWADGGVVCPCCGSLDCEL